ncbi:MAG: tetratricopeptide repeat protein [Polaribacter sp.]
MDENIQKEIERYLQKEMNSKERTLFEQKIEADSELKEEVFLQQSIHDVFANESNSKTNQPFKKEEVEKMKTLLRSEEYQDAYSTIKANTSNYLAQKKKNNFYKKYKYLMAITAIFIVILIIPFSIDTGEQTLYKEFASWNDLPSYVEKGTEKSIIGVEKNYNEKQYSKVIDVVNSFPDTTKATCPNVSLYLGASYFHQNNYDKAIEIFNNFSQSDAYDSSKGYWYMVLVYLKQEKLDEAEKILNLITKDSTHYNYKKATELLQKINED